MLLVVSIFLVILNLVIWQLRELDVGNSASAVTGLALMTSSRSGELFPGARSAKFAVLDYFSHERLAAHPRQNTRSGAGVRLL